MTNLIQVGNNKITMSSREIAQLCEKQHAHVMRDIRNMLDELYPNMDSLDFKGIFIIKNPETGLTSEIRLPKRETMICPHCAKAQLATLNQQISAVEISKKAEKIDRLRAMSGISTRFAEVSFANFERTADNDLAWRTCQRYADKWLERAKSGGGLVLCGRPGTGKNHLACAIAHQVIEQHQAEVFLTMIFFNRGLVND